MPAAVFPGKFDPISMGHLNIIERTARLFERVVVAVYKMPSGGTLFNATERQDLIREAVRHLPNVEVDSFDSLVVNYVRSKGAQAMVRGLRLNTDFEYEFEMALMNHRLAPDIEVVCLITSLENQFIRSSLLKEVAQLGGDISGLAPSHVVQALESRLATRS